MKRTHRHKITFPVFNYKAYVIFTNNILRECMRLTKGEPEEDTKALTVINTQGFCHILLPHDVSAENIAHEACHVVNHIMVWTGAAIEDEVFAYHVGHIVGRITKWRNRHAAKDA